MDYNFDLKPAVKEAVPALIGLWGKSGSGKTYSALLLARGLVGQGGKIAVIDTENGRAKFYAAVGGGWHHLDLQPPFTPEKYSAAFKYCEAQGANAIVVDSMSHVWEGEGGAIDMAENAKSRSGKPLDGLAKWKNPKMSHKRMMNSLTRSPIPVIFCIRAKDATKQIKNAKGETEIISLGWQPIAEKNFIYEMTLDLHMTKDGKYDLEQSKTVPEALRQAVRHDGIVNEAMGRAIAEWSGSGATVDPETMKLRRDGQEAAMQGVKEYTAWLATLRPEQKEMVRDYHKGWSADARTADASAVETLPSPKGDASYLDDDKPACTTCRGKGSVTDEQGVGPCPTCQPSAAAA